MHLLLTDRLTCPRCGPGFGLILLADRLIERRVLAGSLGCSNCRDRFPIADGWADLRPPPRSPLPEPPAVPPPTAEETGRLAAMLGVTSGPGNVALIGALSAHAPPLADLLPGVEVVAIDPASPREAEREGVSRLIVGGGLPFQPWTFRAVASCGDGASVEEIAGLVSRGGRLVVERPGPAVDGALERARLRVLLRQPDWVVALKETP